MTVYATYSEYTQIYSDKGVSESEITSGWLPYGALRVNECLGGYYTTPFSSNNATARDLNIHFAHLGILLRTRKQDDSPELQKSLERRCASLTSSGAPMITDDGVPIFPNANNVFDVYSNTKDYKPVFDLRDPINQRVDPDQLQDEWDEDIL